MEILYPISAGIDVHRDTVVVSIRKHDDRGREPVETRTFETYHDALVEMVAWLDEHHVPIVGLESTGVYWKPVVRALRKRSQGTIWLVNPADVKKVPGRKTDVNDSQWLSKLVMHGLVSPSFLAAPDFEEMRTFARYRTRLVAEQTACKNRILKEIEASGIKLASVCSEPLGKSGRAMLEALLKGTDSPTVIANLALGALRKKIPLLERAVTGTFTAAARFILRQLLDRLDHLGRDIAAIDAQLRILLAPHDRDVDLLLSVPGLDRIAIAGILAEIGPDMSLFGGAHQLTAWAGLCPGSYESAGKSKKAPSRKGDKYLRTMLVQAAWASVRTKGTFWQQKFRQLVVRLGPKKAIVAIARKMLVAIFYMLRDDQPYVPPAPRPPTPEAAKRRAQKHLAALAALGFTLELPVAAKAA